MAGASCETALLEGALPARRRERHHAVPLLFPPLAHVGNVVQRAVGHRLHGFTLTPRATVHAGGNLKVLNGKVMFRIDHLPLVVRHQGTAFQQRFAVAQPQRRIHNVQIVIQQRKAQIVWPNAVGAVLIHPKRSERARLRLQLLIKRREAAVEAHHQRQFFARCQLNQPFRIQDIFRQRFIHADVNARVEQFAHHLVVGGR